MNKIILRYINNYYMKKLKSAGLYIGSSQFFIYFKNNNALIYLPLLLTLEGIKLNLKQFTY